MQGIANHDANGNMTVMPGLKAKYDAWNRLVEVRNSDDLLIATYEYNGLNQRIKKTVNSVVTKSFFNENWQELESVSNNQTTSYIWGLRYIDDLVLREKGTERLYSLADPNWNVVALVNTSGTVMERYTYDAFGKRNVFDGSFTAKANTDYNWNRAFTGQVLDMETMLMLYRMRYYNTLLGRWTSRDPIGYDGWDVNLYRYVFNFSNLATDEIGLWFQTTTTKEKIITASGTAVFVASIDGPLPIGDVIAVIIIIGAGWEIINMSDKSKNEKHGDSGRELERIQDEIKRLQKLIDDLMRCQDEGRKKRLKLQGRQLNT